MVESLAWLRSSVAAVALAIPGAAFAQSAVEQAAPGPDTTSAQAPADTSSAPQSSLEEIVVTAQRRSENLQKVPIAISAVSATTLAATGIKGIDTIRVAVPGLTAQNTNGVLTMFLRGVGTNANGPAFENPFSLYIDGVYIGNQTVGLLQFNNIARIEVLKGPQGTLFGRNATGGLVQIITRDPSQGDLFTGVAPLRKLKYCRGAATRGRQRSRRSRRGPRGALRAPRWLRHEHKYRRGRLFVQVRHIDAVEARLVARRFKVHTHRRLCHEGWRGERFSVVPGTLAAGSPGPASYPKPWDINVDVEPRVRVKDGGVILKAEAQLGDIAVSNLAAYPHNSYFSQVDYDSIPAPIGKRAVGVGNHR